METYAVVGAGGYTGRACVEQLLALGRRVRAVVRDPARCAATYRSQPSLTGLTNLRDALEGGTLRGPTEALRSQPPSSEALTAGPAAPLLEVVAGDVTDPSSLRAALAGCTGIIYAATSSGWMQLHAFWRTMRTTSPQAVDHLGVKNVAQVAGELGCVDRMVLVSAVLVSPKHRRNIARLVCNYLLRVGLMDAKWQGEQALRQSGVSYTIVRPDYITGRPKQPTRLVVQQGDLTPTSFHRTSVADLAAVCVAALTDPAAKNVTLELFSEAVPAAAATPVAPPATAAAVPATAAEAAAPVAEAEASAAAEGSKGSKGNKAGAGQRESQLQEQVAAVFRGLVPDPSLPPEVPGAAVRKGSGEGHARF